MRSYYVNLQKNPRLLKNVEKSILYCKTCRMMMDTETVTVNQWCRSVFSIGGDNHPNFPFFVKIPTLGGMHSKLNKSWLEICWQNARRRRKISEISLFLANFEHFSAIWHKIWVSFRRVKMLEGMTSNYLGEYIPPSPGIGTTGTKT